MHGMEGSMQGFGTGLLGMGIFSLLYCERTQTKLLGEGFFLNGRYSCSSAQVMCIQTIFCGVLQMLSQSSGKDVLWDQTERQFSDNWKLFSNNVQITFMQLQGKWMPAVNSHRKAIAGSSLQWYLSTHHY